MVFADTHKAKLTGFFFGQDNTKVEVLTYWLNDGSDAVQHASDLRAQGMDARAIYQRSSSIAPYRVVAYRKVA